MRLNDEEVNDEAIKRFKNALKRQTGVRNGRTRGPNEREHQSDSPEHERDGTPESGDKSIQGDVGEGTGLPEKPDKPDAEA